VLKTGVALGAVCALGVLPPAGGAAAGAEVLPPDGRAEAAADRWRMRAPQIVRARGQPGVVVGEVAGLPAALVDDGGTEVAVGVDGPVTAPIVYRISAAGARTPLPEVTARLRAALARGTPRPRPLLGPGRAEATHNPGTCAYLLAAAAAMLLLCSRGQGWACAAGFALATEAIGYCQ
jgi:hypothetical protein